MRFASLGSGSKGNATLVEAGGTLLLIDCGFTRKETEMRMARLGASPGDLDAILVTHEHSDHCAGVGPLSRQYDIPVYLSHGTASSGKLDGLRTQTRFNADDAFQIGAVDVLAVPVPHDAREPVQYKFSHGAQQLGVLTDLGSLTPHLVEAFGGCTGLLLEFNHDLELLMNGPYPAALKRRVAGDFGHLNNQQSVEFLQRADTSRLRTLVAGHLSEQNNTPGHTQAALTRAAACHSASVTIACQSRGFDWVQLLESGVAA